MVEVVEGGGGWWREWWRGVRGGGWGVEGGGRGAFWISDILISGILESDFWYSRI